MKLYEGIVESRQDPLKLGRCKVRVVGLHTHDKTQLPTEELPWAYPMQSVNSAAMSGIGHTPIGPVEGTVVVITFMDAPDNQQPIIMGTLGGIPQKSSVDVFGLDDDTVILKDTDTGSESLIPTNESEAASNPPAATDTTPTTDIPTVPPSWYSGDKTKATAGIKAILAACDKYGMKTREQKCSVLAIAGGESGFIPQLEMYNYSTAAGLTNTFATTFKKNHPELVDQYTNAAKKGMSREEFFNFVYDPSNNGRQLGNTQTGDGGKYFGRGFIQITGRSNYTTYGSKAGVDLISNPDLLNSDLAVSAAVSVVYILDRLRPKDVSTSANPGYFYAVKKGIGNDTGDGAAKRLKYYEYFYGSATAVSGVEEKSPAPTTTATETKKYNEAEPSASNPLALGFKDPNNKYPLKSRLLEPDTNRLARGIKTGTLIPVKESIRAVGIPKAMDNGTFDEPLSSFNATYPYNHVFETESGHVQEFDDTPGHERINLYHRKGTFIEIDPNGTEIRHIVGDSYTIVDRNGCLYITGEYNITVDGAINVFCRSDANIEVAGDVDMKVGGDASIVVAKDTNVSTAGAMKIQVGDSLDIKANSINIESLTTFNIKSSVLNETANSFSVNASTYYETVGTSHYHWDGVKYTYTGADTHSRHSGGTDFSNSGDPSRSGSDGASNASTAQTASSANTNLPVGVVGTPLNSVLPYLVAPVSAGESEFLFETEEDWNSPAGIAHREEIIKQYGEAPPTSDEAIVTGGSTTTVVTSCKLIDAMESFANDFRLSEHFTLGMLVKDGNKLIAQQGLSIQQIVCNLSQLCQNILEPMIALAPGGASGYGKQWQINSGFRSASNVPEGGSKTSDHMLGRAIDFTLLPYDSTKAQRNYEFIQQIEKILPYDQMIMEYKSGGSNWIHVGYRGLKAGDTSGGGINRKMAFTMVNGSTYKRDSAGNPTGFFLI